MYDIDAPMSIPMPDDFPTVFTLQNAKMTEAGRLALDFVSFIV